MESELENKRNEFIEGIQVQVGEQAISLFPTDEDVLQKMDKNDKMYSFDMEDIDKKIKITKLTKTRRTIIFIS